MKRHARRDPVTPERALEVFALDGGCMAPRLGGSFLDCWGRNRIEHVKLEPRMGRRGELLVTLCSGHTEDGMKGGYVWCTAAENRQAMRDYAVKRDAAVLASVEPTVTA